MINQAAISTVWNMLLAIAYFEGYFTPGTRAHRNNNPGNLRGWSRSNPKDDKGFDIFPTLQAGVDALWRQIWLNIYRDLTVREFFQGKPGVYPGYAPISDNNPATYASFVSKTAQIPVDNITIRNYIGV